MPADYEAVRDACYAKKRKAHNGKLSKKDMQTCKKLAAIWYFKKHGKPVKHSGGNYLVLNSDGLNLNKALKPLSVLDYDIIIPLSAEDLEKYEIASTGGLARATTLVATDIVIGTDLETVGFSKAEITEAKNYISSRVINQESEEQKSEPEEPKIDDFLPQSDELKQKDLLYVAFKLVHTGGNLNKDYFLEEELIKSQFTPILKPLNWQHGEPNIGTIYLSKFIEATENEASYIKCAAVIYRYKYPEYTKEIVNRYNNDKLSFSMEVWFTDFECSICHSLYNFSDFEICKHLVDRYNEGSAAYRMLHNLTFAGAGVVDNPADVQADSISVANVTYNHNTNLNQNSQDIESEPIVNTNTSKEKEGNDIMNTEKIIKTYSDEDINQLINDKINPLQIKIDEISNTLKETTAARDEALAKVDQLNTEIQNKTTELDKVKEDLAKITEEYASFKKSIEDEKKLSVRLAELNELNVVLPNDEAEAGKLLEQIKIADDATFDLIKKTLSLKSVSEKTSDAINKTDNTDTTNDGDSTKAEKIEDENNTADIPIGATASVNNPPDKLTEALNTIHAIIRGE